MEFGARASQEDFLQVILENSSEPLSDIQEYLKRDMLNVCMGNTDNHPRNTAFLKTPKSIRLSPLYDFSLMYLDSEGITRGCRWTENREVGGIPNWIEITKYLSQNINSTFNWLQFLRECRHQLLELKDKLKEFEQGMGNPTLETLNKLFAPFGFEIYLKRKR